MEAASPAMFEREAKDRQHKTRRLQPLHFEDTDFHQRQTATNKSLPFQFFFSPCLNSRGALGFGILDTPLSMAVLGQPHSFKKTKTKAASKKKGSDSDDSDDVSLLIMCCVVGVAICPSYLLLVKISSQVTRIPHNLC